MGREVGMEVWEESQHYLDEITLQIPITTCAIVESDQHGPEHPVLLHMR